MPHPLRALLPLVALAATTLGCDPSPTPTPAPTLEEVRIGRHPGFDRVVLELAGDVVPHAELTVTERPVLEDGSGREVAVAGDVVVLVRIDPAFGYDPITWEPRYLGPRRIAGHGGVVVEVVLVSDFEGAMTWAVGLTGPAHHHLRTATDPTRIVVDLEV